MPEVDQANARTYLRRSAEAVSSRLKRVVVATPHQCDGRFGRLEDMERPVQAFLQQLQPKHPLFRALGCPPPDGLRPTDLERARSQFSSASLRYQWSDQATLAGSRMTKTFPAKYTQFTQPVTLVSEEQDLPIPKVLLKNFW
jgi:hypothetical protein